MGAHPCVKVPLLSASELGFSNFSKSMCRIGLVYFIDLAIHRIHFIIKEKGGARLYRGIPNNVCNCPPSR